MTHSNCEELSLSVDAKFLNVRMYEEAAKTLVPDRILTYYLGGANDNVVREDNVEAFKKFRLRPRMLRNVQPKTETTILGHKIKLPIGIAPSAAQRIIHKDGEKATSQAAATFGVPFCLSTFSGYSIEEVARASGPDAFLIMQYYQVENKQRSKRMVARAEAAGFKAIAVTVDAPILGYREGEKAHEFEMFKHIGTPNILFAEEEKQLQNEYRIDMPALEYPFTLDRKLDDSTTWEVFEELREITSLPLIAKGVMTAEDALIAAKHGVSAVWVSNHGGRQLDSCLPSIEALKEVVDALKGSGVEVFFDGGVRNGADALKAIGLGAACVFVGRPPVFGLAVNGYCGVCGVMKVLENEFKLAMVLSGQGDVNSLDEKLVCTRC